MMSKESRDLPEGNLTPPEIGEAISRTQKVVLGAYRLNVLTSGEVRETWIFMKRHWTNCRVPLDIGAKLDIYLSKHEPQKGADS